MYRLFDDWSVGRRLYYSSPNVHIVILVLYVDQRATACTFTSWSLEIAWVLPVVGTPSSTFCMQFYMLLPCHLAEGGTTNVKSCEGKGYKLIPQLDRWWAPASYCNLTLDWRWRIQIWGPSISDQQCWLMLSVQCSLPTMTNNDGDCDMDTGWPIVVRLLKRRMDCRNDTNHKQ